jgi:hypothetical protein
MRAVVEGVKDLPGGSNAVAYSPGRWRSRQIPDAVGYAVDRA